MAKENAEIANDLWVEATLVRINVFPRVIIHPNINESDTRPKRLQSS